MATVKKEGSKVYIEGVPSIGWAHTNPEMTFCKMSSCRVYEVGN